MSTTLKQLREKSLSQVAPHLSYFNDCKPSFAISECKKWVNKIFDDVEKLNSNIICLCGSTRFKKEFEEAMKPKTCEGCKFRNTVKFVQVESETLECCSVCVRNCYDYYEPKDNA